MVQNDKISILAEGILKKILNPRLLGIKCPKIMFFGRIPKMALTIFFIFHMIVEGNAAYHLWQISIFRNFINGDKLRD